MKHRTTISLALTLGLAGLMGCSSTSKSRLDEAAPAFAPQNFSGLRRWPQEIRRVAVLPVADASGTLPLPFTAGYDATWLGALQRTQRAEFVPVDRDTYSRWTDGPSSPASTAILPSDWARRIAVATGAEAALLLDLTQVSPYPPQRLGLRAKLVRLETGEILWASDETFDSSDPAVARAARRFIRAGQFGRESDASAVLQSPSKFAAYATSAIAATLPTR